MTEIILTYVGTMLIGFEFVRKLNRLELMLLSIAVWPISPIINAYPMTEREREHSKLRSFLKSISFLDIIYTMLLLPLLAPLSLMSLIAYLLTELVNAIDNGMNWLWRVLISRFKNTSVKFVRIAIEKNKRYRGLSPKKVFEEMKYRKIPFLPIFGIILISVALFMYMF